MIPGKQYFSLMLSVENTSSKNKDAKKNHLCVSLAAGLRNWGAAQQWACFLLLAFFLFFWGGNEWSAEGRPRKSACSCSLLALVSKHWALTPEVKMETHEVHWSWFLFPDLHNFISNNIWCLWRYNTSAKLSRNFFSKQNSLEIYLRLDPKSPEMVKSRLVDSASFGYSALSAVVPDFCACSKK